MLDNSLRFLYCNPAWDAFARANGGTGDVFGASLLRKSFLDFIPAIIRPYFANQFDVLRAGAMTWRHHYECSTPSEFRLYEMQALRLPDENEILICHAKVLSHPHTRPAVDLPSEAGDEYSVRMCCNCRRTSLDDGPGVWNWVPRFLAQPPRAWSVDVCPYCVSYYKDGEGIVSKSRES